MKSSAWVITLCLLLCLAGCESPLTRDMPHDEPELEAPRPEVIAGPYFSSISPDSVKVCFVTDLPALSGVRLVGAGFNQVRRMSLPRKFHAIEFKNLLPNTTYRCDLFINGSIPVSVPLKTYPKIDENSTVVFLAGGAEDPEYLARALNAAKAMHPDAIILAGAQTGTPGSEQGWIDDLLTPNNKATRGLSLLHAPDLSGRSQSTAEIIFPATPLGTSYTLNIGNIQLVMIAWEEAKPEAIFRLAPWLKQTLAESYATYKVVVLPRPIILSGGNGIAIKLLHDLAPVFEEQGVDAVISSGAPFYHRTLPVGSGMLAVNYLALGAPAGKINPQTPSDYTASQHAGGALLSLQTQSGRLEGRAVGVNRSFSDRFLLADSKRGIDNEEIIDRDAIVSSAWARASQVREVNEIALQASRAVADPENPGRQRFLVTNPSPLPFRGRLSWLDANSAFTITPKQIDFDLEPGGAIASVFTFKPGEVPKRMPVLTVECDELQGQELALITEGDKPIMVSQPLLLTQERLLTLPRTDAPIVVDGRPDEAFWNQAVDVGAFVPLHGDSGEGGSVMARIIAGPEGLRARLRCTIPEKDSPPASVLSHDGQVWKDESVEIFIDPHGTGREFYQFAVNTAGVTLEANSRRGIAWDADWQQAIELRDNRYNVELVIPYEALGLSLRPAPGTLWGINLTRNDHTTTPARVMQAAPTHGSNARAGCYLKVTFK
ncbi:MAG: hypothetical protein JXA52_07075 [Planctomycetes bacterium]|nr:hypothetical protein [Planctomycetota bacterium]